MVVGYRTIPTLFILACLTGCGTLTSFYDYKVIEVKDIMASNSATTLSSKEIKREKDGSLEVKYSVLVQHMATESNEDVNFLLDKAYFHVNRDLIPIKCRSLSGEKSVLVLKPHEKARINCKGRLTPTPANELSIKDSVVFLQIPVYDGLKIVGFPIEFRIEELQ